MPRLARQYLLYSDTAPEERAAFDAYADATTARLAAVFFAVAGVTTLVWWPLDFILYAGQPQIQRAMFSFRLGLLVLSILGAATRSVSARLGISPIPLIALCGAAASWVATWSCGRAAPLSPEWFGIAYVFPITTIGFLVSFPKRIMIATLFGVAAWSGYFLGNPEHLAAETRPGATISFMLVTVVSGTSIGHLAYHYLRAGFFATRALESVRGELEDRVRAQTIDLRQFTERLEQLREREHLEIARELLAGPGEELSAIEFEVGLLEESATRQRIEVPLQQVRDLMERMRDTFGRRVGALRPRALSDGDLYQGLRRLIDEQRQTAGIELTLQLPPSPRNIPDAPSSAIFRIVQEALTNVVRHAGATRATVVLEEQADGLRATVLDDGCGIADRGTWRQESVGIIGMHERALRIGGLLRIERVSTGGTQVALVVPWQRMAA